METDFCVKYVIAVVVKKEVQAGKSVYLQRLLAYKVKLEKNRNLSLIFYFLCGLQTYYTHCRLFASYFGWLFKNGDSTIRSQ